MLVKLNSDIVINTNYIIAIEPYPQKVFNSKGNIVKYTLHMAGGPEWFLTEEDYHEISLMLNF